jgi:hypothetical protein
MPADRSRYFPVFKAVNLPDSQSGNDRLDSHARLDEHLLLVGRLLFILMMLHHEFSNRHGTMLVDCR